MNAAGDFTVVWESYQDRPAFNGSQTMNPADAPNSYGIYGQRMSATAWSAWPPIPGPNGEFQSEFVVNTTKDGDQRYPSIAMDENGDFLVVWSGDGKSSDRTSPTRKACSCSVSTSRSDTAGPIVINTLAISERQRHDLPGGRLRTNVLSTNR